MIEINLTRLGQRQVDALLAFEDSRQCLAYYQSPPQLDTTGNHWTLGNDCLLVLAGEVDEQQTLSPTKDPEGVFSAFATRVIEYFHAAGMEVPTHVPGESPLYDLRIVWEDFLAANLIALDEVDEDQLVPVPQV